MSVQIVSPEKAVEVLTIELDCKKDKIEELRARIATLEELYNQAIEIIKEKNAAILDLKNNKGIPEMQDEITRLTAANESMQEDAVQNTFAFGLMLKANKEQAAEIARLTEKVRYAYAQIEALEAK